eukprot:3625574-Amphidinium_carterae.2
MQRPNERLVFTQEFPKSVSTQVLIRMPMALARKRQRAGSTLRLVAAWRSAGNEHRALDARAALAL